MQYRQPQRLSPVNPNFKPNFYNNVQVNAFASPANRMVTRVNSNQQIVQSNRTRHTQSYQQLQIQSPQPKFIQGAFSQGQPFQQKRVDVNFNTQIYHNNVPTNQNNNIQNIYNQNTQNNNRIPIVHQDQYDSQIMVGLIKENQDLKQQINEKEQLLEQLQQELGLYEKQ